MYKSFITILVLSIQTIYAQQLRQPFEFPILLSGSFGELRSNHFHSGIDFKTQGVEGKPIHAVQEGYVSRISISPWGYGNALYLTHPDGTTTVYAHLQRFSPILTEYIKEQQYEQESFSVNLFPEAEQFPFKQGDIIAYSGNTGSSGGPHLHFEVRDTQSEEVLDPIEYFKEQITDTRAPQIQGILVCPIEGKGVVNGSHRKLELKNKAQTTPVQINAWGEIGLAVKAYDYMDNTTNIYGVKEITLYLEDEEIFHSYLDRFAFDETRFLNSFVDYEAWKEQRSFYMRSFVEPGNRLRFINSVNQGIIRINEEKSYRLTYVLADAFGNEVKQTIQIEGVKQTIPTPDTNDAELFYWKAENRFGAKGIRLTIPQGNLYNDFYFRYALKEDSTAIAATHILHTTPVPLHKSAQLSLRLQIDTLENKQQYGIVRLQKGRPSWIGGTYRKGWIDASIKELGHYTIRQDTKAPTITPLHAKDWIAKQRFTFRLTDNLSGVQSYRGEIDGQYVLFEMNSQSVISYKFDKKRLAKGKHTLTLAVIDAAGNRSEYRHAFVW